MLLAHLQPEAFFQKAAGGTNEVAAVDPFPTPGKPPALFGKFRVKGNCGFPCSRLEALVLGAFFLTGFPRIKKAPTPRGIETFTITFQW